MMNAYVLKINDLARSFENGRMITLMEVCGGHTNTVMKYGIRDLLPSNVRLISGPGCPVCVTAQEDIDAMIALARSGVPVATYGDMMDVPGTNGSLAQARARGADVRMIFTADEMLRSENKGRVFFGIGFETTMPMTAYLLEQGVMVYSTHKVILPPMRLLVQDSLVDGFIDPGHVSCIIGAEVWTCLSVPQVISGFQPGQVVRAVYKLLDLILKGDSSVINDYDEVVKPGGNLKAKALIAKNMKTVDAKWRGLGVISASGMDPLEDRLNAKMQYAERLKAIRSVENTVCRCGEILQGKCEPVDCPVFGTACTPEHPVGACMVSETEGACGIAYRFGQGEFGGEGTVNRE